MYGQLMQRNSGSLLFSKKLVKEQSLFFVNEYATIKDQSFFTIAEHPGLTCKQIFLLVRKTSAKSVSMQAVHKAIKQLESKQVLYKSNKKYFVSTDWIQQTKNYLEEASKKLNETDSETELLIVEIPAQNKTKSKIESKFKSPLNQFPAQNTLF